MSDGAKAAIAGVVVVGLLYYFYTSSSSVVAPGVPNPGAGVKFNPFAGVPTSQIFTTGNDLTSTKPPAFSARPVPSDGIQASNAATNCAKLAAQGLTNRNCPPLGTASGRAGTSSTGYTAPVTVPAVTTPIASGPTAIKSYPLPLTPIKLPLAQPTYSIVKV